jgi:hypothetical protein
MRNCIKAKNEWVHTTNWDCVILDEYHYGAWRENAKELFEAEEDNREIAQKGEFDEFDLNVFFSAEGTGTEARFKYEE